MRRRYKAILRGNNVEWIDSPPVGSDPVRVTITFDKGDDLEPTDSDDSIFELLEALAERGGIQAIPDPAKWERDIRQARELPGREKS